MAKSYKIFQGKDGDWYFNILAENGQVMATSEGYTRHRDAVRGVVALRTRLMESVPRDDHTPRPTIASRKLSQKPASLAFDPGMA